MGHVAARAAAPPGARRAGTACGPSREPRPGRAGAPIRLAHAPPGGMGRSGAPLPDARAGAQGPTLGGPGAVRALSQGAGRGAWRRAFGGNHRAVQTASQRCADPS